MTETAFKNATIESHTIVARVKVATNTHVFHWDLPADWALRFLEGTREHIQMNGFSGWRRSCGIMLNMGTVQAIWMEDAA